MAMIAMRSIKYIMVDWLVLSLICHLCQEYHNKILLGMREIMRGSQLDALLQAWTNFSMIYIDMNWDYMIAKLFYEVSCFPGRKNWLQLEKTGRG